MIFYSVPGYVEVVNGNGVTFTEGKIVVGRENLLYGLELARRVVGFAEKIGEYEIRKHELLVRGNGITVRIGEPSFGKYLSFPLIITGTSGAIREKLDIDRLILPGGEHGIRNAENSEVILRGKLIEGESLVASDIKITTSDGCVIRANLLNTSPGLIEALKCNRSHLRFLRSLLLSRTIQFTNWNTIKEGIRELSARAGEAGLRFSVKVTSPGVSYYGVTHDDFTLLVSSSIYQKFIFFEDVANIVKSVNTGEGAVIEYDSVGGFNTKTINVLLLIANGTFKRIRRSKSFVSMKAPATGLSLLFTTNGTDKRKILFKVSGDGMGVIKATKSLELLSRQYPDFSRGALLVADIIRTAHPVLREYGVELVEVSLSGEAISLSLRRGNHTESFVFYDGNLSATDVSSSVFNTLRKWSVFTDIIVKAKHRVVFSAPYGNTVVIDCGEAQGDILVTELPPDGEVYVANGGGVKFKTATKIEPAVVAYVINPSNSSNSVDNLRPG